MKLATLSRAIPLLAAAALLPACGDSNDVHQYKVAKETGTASAPGGDGAMAGPAAPAVPQRLLGAIVTHGDRTWFFKLIGPAAPVAKQLEAFSQFVQSIKFTDGGEKPVTWTVPAGWTEMGGDGAMRYATLQIGPAEDKLAVSVIPLGAAGGGMLENVNRWRGQIGLPATDEAALADDTKTFDHNGEKFTLVDVTGPGVAGGAGRMTPPFAQRGPAGNPPPLLARPDDSGATQPTPAPPPQPEEAEKPKLSYTVPAGWKEEPAKGFRAASFTIGEGDTPAQVSAVPLGANSGGDLINVQRWGDQVGLPKITEADLPKLIQATEVAGIKAKSVELMGPESGLVVVWLERDGVTWYFKLNGPVKIVAEQKPALEAFLKSVKFPGAADAR